MCSISGPSCIGNQEGFQGRLALEKTSTRLVHICAVYMQYAASNATGGDAKNGWAYGHHTF